MRGGKPDRGQPGVTRNSRYLDRAAKDKVQSSVQLARQSSGRQNRPPRRRRPGD